MLINLLKKNAGIGVDPVLTALGASHRLALREGQKENKSKQEWEVKMKKWSVISVLIIVSILLVSAIHVTIASTNTAQTSVPIGFSAQLSLSSSQVSTIWPNLPSVQALEHLNCTFIYNSADFGKIDNSSQLQFNPTGRVSPPIMSNYTTYEPSMQTGKVTLDPNIWLQINSTAWIQVPFSLLTSTNTTDIPTPVAAIAPETSQGVQSPDATTPNTWAMGLYDNPASIAGSTPVLGVFSYGEFADNFKPSSSGAYLFSDILSMDDGAYIWQIGMVYLDNVGYEIVIQAQLNDVQEHASAYFVYPQLNQLYSEFIEYNANMKDWTFYWNQQTNGFVYNDGETKILTGNQPSVCCESNDVTGSDFNNCFYNIGGTYGSDYLAAVGFFYGGNWVPFYPTDPVPWASSYYGGSFEYNQLFNIGIQPGIGVGFRSYSTEQLTFSYPITQVPMGTSFWS